MLTRHTWIRRLFNRRPTTAHRTPENRFRPSVEAIEERTVPTATMTATATLWAGQNINVGTVTVLGEDTDNNDTIDTITITYNTTGGWLLTEAHAWFGTSLSDLPNGGTSRPPLGQLPLKQDPINPPDSTFSFTANLPFTYTVTDGQGKDRSERTVTVGEVNCGETLYFVTHASVALYDGNTVIQSETAFGGGVQGDGNAWWYYFTATAECQETPADYNTFTIGGWGAPAQGSNPGTVLQANFANVFQSGLQVGNITLSTYQEVQSFLRATNKSRFTNAQVTNYLPSTLEKQVVALTLNVQFSAADITDDANATLGDVTFKNLTGSAAYFNGKTVSQFLSEVNVFLSTGTSASGLTASEFNWIATGINEAFNNDDPTDWANLYLDF